MKQFIITTTGTQSPITLDDLGGRELVHPTTNLDLLGEFEREEIRSSQDLQDAIDNGWITAKNENNRTITSVEEVDLFDAQDVPYDNTASGATSSNVQGVLDEHDTRLDDLQSGINTRLLPPVQDITALKAIDTTDAGDYPDKSMINVEDNGLYRLDRDASDAEDIDRIIEPNTGAGRWFKMSSTLNDHNNLSNKQGGTIGEFFHTTQDQNSALAGTNGTPSGTNRYVTNSDPRNTNSRPPTGAASGDLSGNYPNPTVAKIKGRAVGTTTSAKGDLLVDDGTDISRLAVGSNGQSLEADSAAPRGVAWKTPLISWSWSGASDTNNTTNRYLDGVDGVLLSNSPYVVPVNCNLVAISASTSGASTWIAEIRKNGATAVKQLQLTAEDKKFEAGLSIALDAGDTINFYCNGSNITRPHITGFFQQRRS